MKFCHFILCEDEVRFIIIILYKQDEIRSCNLLLILDNIVHNMSTKNQLIYLMQKYRKHGMNVTPCQIEMIILFCLTNLITLVFIILIIIICVYYSSSLCVNTCNVTYYLNYTI